MRHLPGHQALEEGEAVKHVLLLVREGGGQGGLEGEQEEERS